VPLEEVQNHPAELFWTFFVGKVAGAFYDHAFCTAEMPPERFSRSGINHSVFTSPQEQYWNFGHIWQRGLHFFHIGFPTVRDSHGMLQDSRPGHRQVVAANCFLGDAGPSSVHPAKEITMHLRKLPGDLWERRCH
jgi:hypothetical protein